MPGIIDSAPSCITAVDGAKPADDSADFILQAAYEKCQGIMTFGPGTTWGAGGAGANGAYYVLTWIGIIVMLAALAAWVLYERRRLETHVGSRSEGSARAGSAAPRGPAPPPGSWAQTRRSAGAGPTRREGGNHGRQEQAPDRVPAASDAQRGASRWR
jgi:hypothetical protein